MKPYVKTIILAIFLIGIVFFNFQAINAIRVDAGKTSWTYFLYPGMFRAIGEMCFGAWLVIPYQRIREWEFSKIGKVLCTALEAGCYLIVLLINSSYGRAFKSIRDDEIAVFSSY